MTQSTCAATKADGSPCAMASGICPGCGKCLWHCEHRREAAAALRGKGGRARHKVPKPGIVIRTVPTEDLPPGPDTLDDILVWRRWVSRCIADGTIDARTGHEITKSLDGHRVDLQIPQRIAELRKQLAEAKRRKDA